MGKQIRPFVPWHVASFLCMTAGSLLALLTPLVLRWLIDQVLPRREAGLLLAAAGPIFLSYQGRTAPARVGSYFTLNSLQEKGVPVRLGLVRPVDQLFADHYVKNPPRALLDS